MTGTAFVTLVMVRWYFCVIDERVDVGRMAFLDPFVVR